MISFLQTDAWGEFQKARGNKVFQRSGQGWSYLAIKEKASFGFSRLYCPYGPVASSKESLKDAIEDLRIIAGESNVDAVRVQPTGIELDEINSCTAKIGFKRVTYSQPIRTWLLDLSSSLDEIYADMKQNTRNICRNYQKKGMTYSESDDPKDIDILVKLLDQVAIHNQVTFHDKNYFRLQAQTFMPTKAAKLHFIKKDGSVIAAALTYRTNDSVAYAHAAADFEHRSLNPSTALVGEIIRNAKQEGFKQLDFYGIASTDDPLHKQAGLTKFKKSFGGFEQCFSPTVEIGTRNNRYKAYRLLRRLRGLDK